MDKKHPLLQVEGVTVYFSQYTKELHEKKEKVITDGQLTVNRGEIVAVIGASGSGKSLLAHMIVGLLPKNAHTKGKIYFKGKKLTTIDMARIRGKEIALIPQSVNALNPLMKAGKQVQLAMKRGNKMEKRRRLVKIFTKMNLEPDVGELYPFQLSGGMARRVLLATAFASEADLLIADEATPGIDEQTLMETKAHLRHLANEGRGIMLITHDIRTALSIADKVVVFYAGTTVEIAQVQDFSGDGDALRHPYTKALWQALPQNEFTSIEENKIEFIDANEGCPFVLHCPLAQEKCVTSKPTIKELRGGMVRCFYA